MPVRDENSMSFKDEIRTISPWAFFFAVLGFLAMIALLVFAPQTDKNPPPMPLMALLGVVVGTVLGCYILLIGYVNRDAGRRGMSRTLWTVLAIFIPNGFGIVLYFILRKPRVSHCPQCSAPVRPDFGFCPRCRYCLSPVCPYCRRGVNASDKFCPYCGGDLGTGLREAVPDPVSTRP